jgi:hypothetical protein
MIQAVWSKLLPAGWTFHKRNSSQSCEPNPPGQGWVRSSDEKTKREKLLPQETTLQIESGRQRDPKESWREETHRSFYTHRGFYTEKSLHKGDFYIQVLHREVYTLGSFCRQTSRSFYTQKFLHEEVFAQRVFYTQMRLHTETFTQREAFTRRVFTHGSFYTQRNLYTDALSHREAFTHRRKLLHKEVFTQRNFYTRKLLHTKAFTQRSLCTEAPLHEVTS